MDRYENHHQYIDIRVINSIHVSPFGEEYDPSFEQTWIPFTQECFVLKIAKWLWKGKFVNIFNIILQFSIFSLSTRVWPFIWTNLNPLHPRMLYAKFGLNLPSGSGDENVKSLEQWQWQKWRQRTNFYKNSLHGPSAQVSYQDAHEPHHSPGQ